MSQNIITAKQHKRLHTTLTADIERFRCLGKTTETQDGPLTFIDRGSNILGVAHLDYVMTTSPRYSKRLGRVYCPQLDDRLGVWVLLSLLPTLGCPTFDVLLTDNEERGLSTAKHFEPPKDRQYSYIFEFDRAGTDVVLYEYEDADMLSLCELFGWEVGLGSFSDISYLEHLGCKGFNIGTGYYKQHTLRCYANLEETLAQAKRFVRFAKQLGDERLPHIQRPKTFGYWPKSSQSWGSNWRSLPSVYRTDLHCDDCGSLLDVDWFYCPFCGEPVDDTERYQAMDNQTRSALDEYDESDSWFRRDD